MDWMWELLSERFEFFILGNSKIWIESPALEKGRILGKKIGEFPHFLGFKTKPRFQSRFRKTLIRGFFLK
ncbi:hypothetical protein DLM78_05430 [Leptospira stimsonii]|uniref:Uncharacterized protein n=1 Tax=Leptospira stimsonii TaxID=2202203 RepID=A0A8B3CZN8_9LEPT|nr:hypothetical protein DLM78_05430 [Leptospira stimsonii]